MDEDFVCIDLTQGIPQPNPLPPRIVPLISVAPPKKAKLVKPPLNKCIPGIIADLKKKALNQTIIYGLDLSTSSPGLAKVDSRTKRIDLWGYASLARHVVGDQFFLSGPESTFPGWSIVVHTLKKPDYTLTHCSLDRFNVICNLVPDLIQYIDHAGVVYIEGYAMASKKSFSSTLLPELGGVVRFELFKRGCHIVEVSPMSVKKHFSGSGRADKEDMYHAYLDTYKLPDLLPVYNPPPPPPKAGKSKKSKNIADPTQPVKPARQRKESKYPGLPPSIPSPLNDMIDALALAFYGVFYWVPPE